ncbi:MAG: radical SAM protein, partial [Promethearchaeota archaeon]
MRGNKLFKSKEETFFIKQRGIPKGCKYCLQGAKTVLFLSGICQNPPHCRWYCPISEVRKNKNLTYANEILINSEEELLREINVSRAKGMSITGGDPLYEPNLEKTISYLKYIKKKKGSKFHVHLYTNGLNFDAHIAQRLSDAGLDEIRFNPPEQRWFAIELALNNGLIAGAEVPIIPSQEYIAYLKRFIFYLDHIGAFFINLNEFEMCVTNSEGLKDRGFNLKKGSIASVEGSREYALDLVKNLANNVSLKIHFCSVRSKDFWQLARRYLRRAKSIKKPYESITDEGLLLFGQIETHDEDLKNLYPII